MNSENLTSNQLAAVSTLDQNVSVLAGAGTGKTKVLVDRFLAIIQQALAKPAEILAITFTDKAANEMKARIVKELRDRGLNEARHEIENAYIGTIHAFCSRLLKEHPMEAGIDPDFRVCEEEEADLLKETVLEQLIEERFREESVFSLLSVYDEEMISKRIKHIYERIKTSGISCAAALESKKTIDISRIQQDLAEKLLVLLRFDKKKAKAEEALACLKSLGPPSWEQVDLLTGIDGWFNLKAHEGKEETRAAKEALQKLIAGQVEILAQPFKQTFESLLIDFDRRYTAAKRERAVFDFSDLETNVLHLLSSETESSAAVRERYQKQFRFIMVDEFQDTNSIQVQILELLRRPKNLFLVGDVKQSIYGFRGAQPELFYKKQMEFDSEKTGISIKLLDNFRSRSELLNFINPFFEQLWKQNEIPYETLISKQTFKDGIETPVDLIVINKGQDETAAETRSEEARVIAARIRELADQGYRYGDFAILFRAGECMQLYEQELRNFQIPHYVIGGRGFYHQPEIRDVMNLLTILENPLREVPFAAVLRSPMFQVTDDTLFWLSQCAKQTDKRTPLFEGFKVWRGIQEISESGREKLTRFQSIFEELLVLKGKLSITELLEIIFKRIRYDLYVLGLAQGKRHFANLKKLIDLARELEERETVHLGDFVRYVKGLLRHEVRESEAQVEAAEGDVVRLLTIHKAKGLEFRCVIVPDLARKLKSSDIRFVFDFQSGLGIEAMNPLSGEFEDTLTYQTICERADEWKIQESKRLLYVAMTRAKERLIFAGTARLESIIKPESSNWFDWVRLIIQEQNLPANRLDLETTNLKRRKLKPALIDMHRIRSKIQNLQPISMKRIPEETNQVLRQLKPYPAEFFERVDLPVSAYVAFDRDSAHEEYRQVYELGAASAVPDLKSEEQPLVETEETISAADFGTLVHQIFEHLVNWNFSGAVPIDEWIRFYGQDFDSSVQDKASQLARVFLKSKLFSSIQKAKRVFTELPFVLRLHHGIVQGTLDLLYETASGELVIVDYKTSEVDGSNLKKKAESYRKQMELYALACRELLGIFPTKAILYFVKIDATYDIIITSDDYKSIKSEFEFLQKQIIEYRKQLSTQLTPNIQS